MKFQKIVAEEQDANFITRLHGGKLDIIPWPVIESRRFYTLFPRLKKRLDQQKVTHSAAGEFLHMLKTLMAKLKVSHYVIGFQKAKYQVLCTGKRLEFTISYALRHRH